MPAVIGQRSLPAGSQPRKRFTRDEVDQMLDAGMLVGQRFELIGGDLIDKMGQKPLHATAIRILMVLLAKIFGIEMILVQSPIEVAPSDRVLNFPEPDVAMLLQLNSDYAQRHPRGDELALVVEVADTSFRFDSTVKRDLYARAGVPEYWVLGTRSRRLVIYRRPENGAFTETQTLNHDETASPQARPDSVFPVAAILPDRWFFIFGFRGSAASSPKTDAR